MTESMLHGLMKLFAILASIRKRNSEELSENFVESFLSMQFSRNLVKHSLSIFNDYLEELNRQQHVSKEKKVSVLSVKILTICNQINREMHVRNKYFILISLIQFSKYFDDQYDTVYEFGQTITDVVRTISDGLLIETQEYENCQAFIKDKFYKVPDRNALLVVNSEDNISFSNINHLYRKNLDGNIYILHIRQGGIYIFYYSGESGLKLGGKPIYANHIYILPKGSSLKSEGSDPIYYSDVVGTFLNQASGQEIKLEVKEISYHFPKTSTGIKPVSFHLSSRNMMGIMGGSGTGKSTLMKLLCGSIPMQAGDILINGKSLPANKEEMSSLIGYIPQDDLLIEELTVFENLYFSAKLSMGNRNEHEIRVAVLRTLNTLDLLHIRDLKVGSALNKLISGGQRKRLNIALELIREPSILFADEPTSGLSSTDSEKVIQLLKEQALLGKIVILNIHQPSSEIYKMLDSLLILDRGGYPVYFGNPMEAFSFLKNAVRRIDASEIECSLCGNVQTDELLQVIESSQVDEFGEYINERVVPPEYWYKLYCDNYKDELSKKREYSEIPPQKFKPPNIYRQFATFFTRNFLSKVADRQYVLFAVLIAPTLALILGFFTKFVHGTPENPREYIFSRNENLPSYIFMSVIVALFIGLIISAEEIIKDRKILARERFLKLSRYSYLNSKILFLFGLTAFQMLAMVLIGNNILEIRGMTWSYWIVLFSTAAFAVLLGLNISSSFKSVIAIYINIPFILVPLILLAGVIVKYDKLHYMVSSQNAVPVVGDLMASRWAYEALMVNQFKNNSYEVNFFDIEKDIANVKWELNYFLPEILNQLDDYRKFREDGNTDRMKQAGRIIVNSIDNEKILTDFNRDYKSWDNKDINELQLKISRRKDKLRKINLHLTTEKDLKIDNILSDSSSGLLDLHRNFYNESVADLVLNNNDLKKLMVRNNRIIRKDSPIFYDPVFRNGRSHFYSSQKRVGPYLIDTVFFNTVVLWLMSLILYFSLIFNWSARIINILTTRLGITIKSSSRMDIKE